MSDSADDSDWLASEDISVLRELLQTPEPSAVETLRPGLVWGHRRRDHEDEEDESDGETKGEDDGDEEKKGDSMDHGLVVTALRRQVQLLQQEYDRHLEQNVARSVVKAGGKSAPRAATIKLYRNYERLARVSHALVAENQRLVALLKARQHAQEQWLQSVQASRLEGAPFRAVDTEGGQGEDRKAILQAHGSPLTGKAEAKEPTAQVIDYSNEEIS